jgi:hypothetical protein
MPCPSDITRNDLLQTLEVDLEDLAAIKAKKGISDHQPLKKEQNAIAAVAGNALPVYIDTLMPVTPSSLTMPGLKTSDTVKTRDNKTTAAAIKDPSRADLSALSQYNKVDISEEANLYYQDTMASAKLLGSAWERQSVVSDSTMNVCNASVDDIEDTEEETRKATAAANWLVAAWNKLRGRTETVEDKEIALTDEAIAYEKAIEHIPLALRPQLFKENDVIQQDLKKLIEEMVVAVNHYANAAAEVSALNAADAENVIKKTVKLGNINTRNLLQQDLLITSYWQMEGLKDNRVYISLINDVRGTIAEQAERSRKLGWVAGAATAVAIIAGIALCFATGGTAAIVLGAIGAAGSLASGISGIIRAVTDYLKDLAQGKLSTYDISRELNKYRTERLTNESKALMTAMLRFAQNMAKNLKSERDTIESMSSQR